MDDKRILYFSAKKGEAKMRNKITNKPKRVSAVITAVILATSVLMPGTAIAKSMKLTLCKAGELPGAFSNPDTEFYSSQGFAFDTFSGEDAYAVTLNNARTKGKISHMKYENGKFIIEKELVYKKSQINHANDAAVFKKGNETYLFIAKGGDGNKTSCFIKISDFEKEKKKVYPVTFKKMCTASGSDLRGIAYAGKEGKKDIFLVEAGRRINKMQLVSIGSKAVFKGIDNQRIQAPKTGKREGTANGITYHNGSIYAAYGDEDKGKGGKNKTAFIDSISMKKLFNNKNTNTAIKFPNSWKKTYTIKFTPESVFFTKLNRKGNLYMTCNGGQGSNHRDYIYKSKQKR